MFNGIVQEIGRVINVTGDSIKHIIIDTTFANTVKIGDSVAVNGVCLTVTNCIDNMLYFDVVSETLSKTNLSFLTANSPVNLELPLQYHDYISGHLVQGHVDGVGVVENVIESEKEKLVTIKLTTGLSDYMITKGCICIDGTSLTIVKAESDTVSIALIPHTLAHTIAQFYQVGVKVNIEVDMVARYLQKYATGENHVNA